MADGTLVGEGRGTIENPETKTEPVVFYARGRWETILKPRGKQGVPIPHQRGASAAEMQKTGFRAWCHLCQGGDNIESEGNIENPVRSKCQSCQLSSGQSKH